LTPSLTPPLLPHHFILSHSPLFSHPLTSHSLFTLITSLTLSSHSPLPFSHAFTPHYLFALTTSLTLSSHTSLSSHSPLLFSPLLSPSHNILTTPEYSGFFSSPYSRCSPQTLFSLYAIP